MAPREEGLLIGEGFLIVVMRSGIEVGIVHVIDTTMCRMYFGCTIALFRLSFRP